MAHRGAVKTVTRKGKARNVPATMLNAFEQRGWVQTPAVRPAPDPVEAKAAKPKKEKPEGDVDTEK